MMMPISSELFSLVQCSVVSNTATPWTASCQGSLSFTNSRSLLKLMSIQSVMPSNHLILCHPVLLLPSVFPSIRVISGESLLPIRWPKYWSFSFSISPSNEYSGLISFAWCTVNSKQDIASVLVIINSPAMNIGCMCLFELRFSQRIGPDKEGKGRWNELGD